MSEANMKPREELKTAAPNVIGRVELKGRDLAHVERAELRKTLKANASVPHFNSIRGLDKLATVKPSAPRFGEVNDQIKLTMTKTLPLAPVCSKCLAEAKCVCAPAAQLDGQKTLDEAMRRRMWKTTVALRSLRLKCGDGVERFVELRVESIGGAWSFEVIMSELRVTGDAPSEKLAKVYAQRRAKSLAASVKS